MKREGKLLNGGLGFMRLRDVCREWQVKWNRRRAMKVRLGSKGHVGFRVYVHAGCLLGLGV